MGTIKGKALLVITATGSKWVPFDVCAFIQSCSGTPVHRYVAQEDFTLLETDTLSLPAAAYKLKTGETARIKVVFLFECITDYWGESDIHLDYLKERVLRKQKAPNRYRAKS